MKHGDRMTVNVLGRDVEVVADERVPKGTIVPMKEWERLVIRDAAAAAAVAAAKCSPGDYIFREGDFSAPMPPPRDANGREIKVGDRVRMLHHDNATSYGNVVGIDSDGRVRVKYDGGFGAATPIPQSAALLVVIDTAPQPADAPEPIGLAERMRRHREGAAKTSASGSGESADREAAGRSDGDHPSPFACSPEPESITCDDCGAVVQSVRRVTVAVAKINRYCIYCYRRLNTCLELGPGITAAPPPVVDEDGEQWASATWES